MVETEVPPETRRPHLVKDVVREGLQSLLRGADRAAQQLVITRVAFDGLVARTAGHFA